MRFLFCEILKQKSKVELLVIFIHNFLALLILFRQKMKLSTSNKTMPQFYSTKVISLVYSFFSCTAISSSILATTSRGTTRMKV